MVSNRARVRRDLVGAVVLLVGLGMAGCADVTPGPSPESPGVSAPINDPALSAAADSIEPFVQETFPDTYAGIRLDHEQRTIIIYRRPDPGLDAAVRARFPQVDVRFQDARFSLVQMKDLANRVVSDGPYWRSKGVDISSVGPAVNGSGVEVMVSEQGPDPLKAMSERYGEGTIILRRGGVMPIPPGPRFIPSSSAPPSR